jgi:hypothetical protein
VLRFIKVSNLLGYSTDAGRDYWRAARERFENDA